MDRLEIIQYVAKLLQRDNISLQNLFNQNDLDCFYDLIAYYGICHDLPNILTIKVNKNFPKISSNIIITYKTRLGHIRSQNIEVIKSFDNYSDIDDITNLIKIDLIPII